MPGGFSIAGYRARVRTQWMFRAAHLPKQTASALPHIHSIERCTDRKFPSERFSHHPDVGSALREIQSFPSRQPGYPSRAGEYLLRGRSPQSGVPTTLNTEPYKQFGNEVVRGAIVRSGEGSVSTKCRYLVQLRRIAVSSYYPSSPCRPPALGSHASFAPSMKDSFGLWVVSPTGSAPSRSGIHQPTY